MAKAKTQVKCDGCNAPLQHVDMGPAFTSPNGVRVQIAPKTTVTVCATMRYSGLTFREKESTANPKLPCIRKAWEKAQACPGCGTIVNPFEGLCSACRDRLSRAQEMLGDRPTNYALDVSLVSGVYPESLHQNGKELSPRWRADELLTLITRAIASAGPRRMQLTSGYGRVLGDTGCRATAHGGMPSIELDDGQKAAVQSLGAAIRAFADAMYHQGRRAGRDLLGGIAAGKLSIDDFSERIQRWDAEEGKDNGRGK